MNATSMTLLATAVGKEPCHAQQHLAQQAIVVTLNLPAAADIISLERSLTFKNIAQSTRRLEYCNSRRGPRKWQQPMTATSTRQWR